MSEQSPAAVPTTAHEQEPSPRMLFLQQFTRALIASVPAVKSSFEIEGEKQWQDSDSLLFRDDEKKEEVHAEESPSSLSPAALSKTAKSETQHMGRHVVPSLRHHGLLQRQPLSPFQLKQRGPAAPLPYRIPQLVLHQRPPPPKIYLAPPTESWLANMQSLSRIQSLLKDPTITFIDCPGPGIPITIARGSLTQSTPFHFSAEEIEHIIRDISERTHIPLSLTGIFKAAMGNIVITALLSEFVGTRFVLQKKKPSDVKPVQP